MKPMAPGMKFRCCVWMVVGNFISTRKDFKTIEGARRYAEKRCTEPAVNEVSIIIKDKSNKVWPWRRIEVIKNPQRDRAREAARREAQDKKGRKR